MVIYWKGLFIRKIDVKCVSYTVQRSSPCPSHACYETVVLVFIYNPGTAIHFEKKLCWRVPSSCIVTEIAKQTSLDIVGGRAQYN